MKTLYTNSSKLWKVLSFKSIGTLLLFSFLFTHCGDDETAVTEALGSGYNVVTATYADLEVVESAILDIDSILSDDLVEVKELKKAEFDTIEGTSITEYTSSLSVSVGLEGNYGAFFGSVDTNFNTTTEEVTEHSFATVKSVIKKFSHKISQTLSTEDLKEYLTDSAKEDINDSSVTPEDLFAAYGTHLLSGIILGGRLDYNVQADMSQVTTTQSIGVYAEAGFSAGIKSISVTSEVESEEAESQFEQTVSKSLKVYGGDEEAGQAIISGGDYDTWLDSIEDDQIFCDILNDGLVGIWEFADDTTRQTELEDAFIALATATAEEYNLETEEE